MKPLNRGEQFGTGSGMIFFDVAGPIDVFRGKLINKDNDVLMFNLSASFISELRDELERLSTVKIGHIERVIDDAIYEGY